MPSDRKRMQWLRIKVEDDKKKETYEIEIPVPCLTESGRVELVKLSKPMPMSRDLMFDDWRESF